MELVLALATVALAVTAAWYACETRRIVERMDKERETRQLPKVALQVVPMQARHAKLRIINVGAGPAFEVKGRVEGRREGTRLSFDWSSSLLLAGKYEDFGFPSESAAPATERFNLDAITSRFETLHADFRYESASGKVYESTQEIAITALVHSWFESQMMATEDHPERLLPRIARATEEIANNLKQ